MSLLINLIKRSIRKEILNAANPNIKHNKMVKCHFCGHYRTAQFQRWADFYHYVDPNSYSEIMYSKQNKLAVLKLYYPEAVEITDGFIMERVYE